MTYLKNSERVTRAELDVVLDSLEVDGDVPLHVIMKVDYVFYGEDADYDGGLSFLDRLYKKLNWYYNLSWDLDAIKAQIRGSSYPPEDYYNFLSQNLTQDMIDSYGV